MVTLGLSQVNIDDYLQIDAYHVIISAGNVNIVPLKTEQCIKEEYDENFPDAISKYPSFQPEFGLCVQGLQ